MGVAPEIDDVSLARKAGWAYRRAASRCGRPALSRGVFELWHLDAWREHGWYAGQAAAGVRIAASVPDLRRTLLVTWHLPEYPLLLPLLAEQRALVLVAEVSPWLGAAAAASGADLCPFRRPGAGFEILRAFRDGRPVAAMLDYCYDETASVVADFCGYPARTPIGVFRVGYRFGYTTLFVQIDETGRVAVLDRFPCARDPVTAARRVNRVLERVIFDAPPRWLLWASVDRRWIGTDYGESG
jgi:hypothetical protein